MIVYATEFPAQPGTTLEAFLSVCHLWLTGSPHYPFKDLQPLVAPNDEIVDLSRSGHQLHVAAINEVARRRAGLRHAWIESGRQEWVSELVASEDADGLWVLVSISCEMLVPGATPPIPKKPYVIKRLFEQLGGGQDGGLATQDKPHHLSDSQLELAASVITGNSVNHLPAVYVSCGFLGRPVVDVDDVARRLGGIAHVIVEPSRRFSIQLAQRVGAANPYGGAVGLLWPSAQGRHMKYLSRFFRSSKELVDELEKDIRSGWLFRRSPRNSSWAYIKEAISFKKLNELRQRGSHSLNEYIAAFDEENSALRDQLRRAEARSSHLEEMLRAIQERESSRGDVRFSSGSEQEFYPDELRDAVLRTLQEDLNGLSTDSRRAILIGDFLAANEASDAAERLEEGIKECLSKTDRVTSDEVKRLTDLGFRITDDGKHYKAVYRDDPRFTFSIFKTASDHRSGKNLASDIIKRLTKR